MEIKTIIGGVMILLSLGGLSACETISESECVAGNWADLGYRDGVSGKSSSRIAEYVEKCSEFGAQVDRGRYFDGYDRGLDRYCVYDRGFSLGEDGGSYNSVCDGARAAEFRAGYEDGHEKYVYYKQYDDLQDNVHRYEDQLEDVRARLSDKTLSADERFRLEKKERRLYKRLKDARWELRKFERREGFRR